jgi:hypothetical protein
LTRASRINKYFQEIFITSNCQTPEKITYYTPDGIEVANPQYGIYIIVTKYTDGKTTVSKKILK